MRIAALLFLVCITVNARTVQFTPLDPDLTDPTEFWMPVWNPVPDDYISAPRYPIVPTPGPYAINILRDLIPNGTVPNVPAKPTNIWQKNIWGFQFNESDELHWNAIYPYPYIVSPKDGNVFIMYPGSPVNLTENRQIVVGFDAPFNVSKDHPIKNASSPWMTMAAGFDLIVTIPNTKAKLRNLTDIGVTLDYLDASNKTIATLYLSKGSPFVNIECFGAMIGFGNKQFPFVPPTIGLNGLNPGSQATGTDFTITTAAGPAHPQGVTWHAYFSSSVTLEFPAPPTDGINVTSPFTGFLQVGCGEINDQGKELLDKAKGVFVKGVELEYDIDDTANQATMTFKFVKGGNANQTLTMLALRHHVKLLMKGTPVADSVYWCAKGNLSVVEADSWQLKYNLTSVGFGDNLHIDVAMKEELLNASMVDYALRIDHCPGDNNTQGYPGQDNMELYAYARGLAQMTDIAIILEVLGKKEHAVNMSMKVLQCIQPILARPDKPPRHCPIPLDNYTVWCARNQMDLYFDTQFGGLVSNWYNRFAEHYCACDLGNPYACIGKNYCDNLYGWSALSNYGNPIYNDHHFQYGYVVKSLSWLLYYQGTKGADLGMNASVVHNITKQALVFAREIGNPDPNKDKYFTFLRHKDIFDGHSWAEGYDYSGRFVSWNNQQSGGESINAYYGIYLLGVALNDSNVRDWGRITLATEMVSIGQYQHMSNATKDKVGQPFKEANQWGKCLSTLYGTGFSGDTYFGENAVFECGITILPVSPITREWVDPSWAHEANHWLTWVTNNSGYCVFYDPIHNATNPCPGANPLNWTGNAFGCCPTNEGIPHWFINNQWRTYPEWMPYLYVMESFYNATNALKKLTYTSLYQPTVDLPFPYLTNRSVGQISIVGYQADLTMTSALFHVATHIRP